jgi:hypothetical protein
LLLAHRDMGAKGETISELQELKTRSGSQLMSDMLQLVVDIEDRK